MTTTKTWYSTEGTFLGDIWAIAFYLSGDILAAAGDNYAVIRRGVRVWYPESGLTATNTWYSAERTFLEANWAIAFNPSGFLRVD